MQERYRSDLAAYGRGEIGSLFGNLDRDAEAARKQQILLDARGQYAELEAMRLSTVRRDIVPARDPRSIPLAEQYGSYGKAESDARRDAAVRRLNADPLQEFLNRGVTNPAAGLEKRLNSAGLGNDTDASSWRKFLFGSMADGNTSFRDAMKIDLGAEEFGQTIEGAMSTGGEQGGQRFGEAASQKLNAEAAAAGNAYGTAAAAAFNSNVRPPRAFPGNTGQSVTSPDDL